MSAVLLSRNFCQLGVFCGDLVVDNERAGSSKVFYLLFATIFFLMWLTDFTNIHTYVFIFLALGLYFSVRFFVTELKKAQEEGKLGGDGEEAERQREQEQEEMKRKLEQEEEKRRREQAKMVAETRKDR